MERVRLLQKVIADAFRASRWHCKDLTDDEYFHKLVTPCWGVWRRGEARRTAVEGAGEWVVDTHGSDPPLVPTIGWRLTHLAVWTDIYRAWTFTGGRPRQSDYEFPGTAAEAVRWLERANDAFADAVRALDASELDDMRSTHYGTQRSVKDLVWDIAVEHVHHGAEIGVLRDLIRGRARDDLFPGPWE